MWAEQPVGPAHLGLAVEIERGLVAAHTAAPASGQHEPLQ
jgi:hypothetical protein